MAWHPWVICCCLIVTCACSGPSLHLPGWGLERVVGTAARRELCATEYVAKFWGALAVSNVLVAGAANQPWIVDVQTKLQSTGLFSTVTVANTAQITPTVSYLQTFDAVLAFTDIMPADMENLSANFAYFVDGGGALVTAMFIERDFLGPNWNASHQVIVTAPNAAILANHTIGVVPDPSSLIMAGVSNFNGGTSSFRADSTTIYGIGVIHAYWDDGRILAASRQIGTACRVDINMYPPSNDVREDLWMPTTDGARLMANALIVAGSNNCPSISPTPSVTPTSSVTPSVTPTSSVTPSVSPTPSVTPTSSVTPTTSQTPSVTPTSSLTPTPTATRSVTPTSSITPTASATPTRSLTPSVTPTSSVTPTASVTPSPSTSPTPTSSVTPTATPTITPTPTIAETISPVLVSCADGCTQPLTGGTACVLRTSVFPAGMVLSVGRTAVSYTIVPPATVAFVAPPQAAGYANVTAVNPWTGALSWVLIYYDDCTGANVVMLNGQCVQCPTGAYCPGGDRMWPLPGYWTPDEHTPPVACFLPYACPGATLDDGISNPHDTTLCAAGYRGQYCSLCDTGYYNDDGRCRSCRESAEAAAKSSVDLTVLYVTAAVAVFLLMVGVAIFPSQRLNAFISTLLIVQQLIYVGRNAAKFIPGPTGEKLADAFRSMSILLLDIEFLQPACSLPNVTFIGIFWGTLVAVVIASVLLVASSAIYGLKKWRQDKSRPWNFYFRARATYALIVLCFIVYLEMCLRIFQAVDCKRDGAGVQRLQVQLDIVCYAGSHLPVGAVAWILLILFALGFPVYLLIGLVRAVRGHHLEEFSHEQFGYIVQGLNMKWFWFRTAAMFNTLILTAETVFILQPDWRVFASCTTFLFNFTLGASMWPFLSLRDNILTPATGLANIIQIIVYEHQMASLGLMWAAIVILILSILLFIPFRYRPTRRFLESKEKCKNLVCCGDCGGARSEDQLPRKKKGSRESSTSTLLSSFSEDASPMEQMAPSVIALSGGSLSHHSLNDYGTPAWKKQQRRAQRKRFERRRKRATLVPSTLASLEDPSARVSTLDSASATSANDDTFSSATA